MCQDSMREAWLNASHMPSDTTHRSKLARTWIAYQEAACCLDNSTGHVYLSSRKVIKQALQPQQQGGRLGNMELDKFCKVPATGWGQHMGETHGPPRHASLHVRMVEAAVP